MEEGAWASPARLIWLLDCDAEVTDMQLDAFAAYGHGLGPDKVQLLIPVCKKLIMVTLQDS